MAALAQPRFAQSPLLILAVAISTGILVGSWINSHPRTVLIFGASIIAGFTVLSKWFVRRRKPATTLLLVAGFIFSGLALSLMYGRELAPGRISRMYEQGLITASESGGTHRHNLRSA
jgi:hypothetical protein